MYNKWSIIKYVNTTKQRRVEKITKIGLNRYRVKYRNWNDKFDDYVTNKNFQT